MERFFEGREQISIFLFGAGPIAERIILALQACAADTIKLLTVRSRTGRSAEELAARLRPQVSFELVSESEGRAALSDADFVITATNAKAPVFDAADVKHALILHLGGDETPADYLEQALRRGSLLCDSVEMVSRRNSQSLALYFSQHGTTLETAGPLLGVKNLAETLGDAPVVTPAHITCVGLPMLDLYVGAHVYETLLMNEGITSSLAGSV
jgi:alanine dehydrogenase